MFKLAKIRKEVMLSIDVKKALEYYCDKLNISSSMIVNYAIRDYLKEHGQELKKYFRNNNKTLLREMIISFAIEYNKDVLRVTSLVREMYRRLEKMVNDGVGRKQCLRYILSNYKIFKNQWQVLTPEDKNHFNDRFVWLITRLKNVNNNHKDTILSLNDLIPEIRKF